MERTRLRKLGADERIKRRQARRVAGKTVNREEREASGKQIGGREQGIRVGLEI